ncbi:hypothetical protein ATANTOWER_007625 [Ataeniobius toweri]|uniref:Uncharacterized protein n=1 Tax=Ataeniobius toweri TaxID=208326 RepID=A0ABU7BTM7_9TELE|nr:hypothetical protein [Ataeniobius toweri]
MHCSPLIVYCRSLVLTCALPRGWIQRYNTILKVGDKVLALLPVPGSALDAKFSCPYEQRAPLEIMGYDSAIRTYRPSLNPLGPITRWWWQSASRSMAVAARPLLCMILP